MAAAPPWVLGRGRCAGAVGHRAPGWRARVPITLGGVGAKLGFGVSPGLVVRGLADESEGAAGLLDARRHLGAAPGGLGAPADAVSLASARALALVAMGVRRGAGGVVADDGGIGWNRGEIANSSVLGGLHGERRVQVERRSRRLHAYKVGITSWRVKLCGIPSSPTLFATVRDMDRDEAERRLAAAAAEHRAAKASAEQTREQLYDVVREVAPLLRQVDIVKATGWTREHIRRIVDGQRQV
jgi:hypothetical protein